MSIQTYHNDNSIHKHRYVFPQCPNFQSCSVVELLNAFGLILLFQNYLFPNKIKPYHAIIIQRRRIKPCIMILLFIYLFQPFIGNTMMSLNKSNNFKLDVKQCTTRVLSIYVASPATSPDNSATLTYASWRRAFR